MSIDASVIENIIQEHPQFSGVVHLCENGRRIIEEGFGYANRAENIPNGINTRFATASGCKVFTAVAVCQLVERGLITLDTKLANCVDVAFPNFDPDITVYHLLTHSAGNADYFDEETMDDYGALWKDRPMYNIRGPRDFLPMFQNGSSKFKPGQRFSYSDGGFILLGLIVEVQSGEKFTDYVEKNIFTCAEMSGSGYFATDRLPECTAYHYIEDESDGSWRTNFFAVPIIGAPDGGAYTTAPDMDRFWSALFGNKLLGKELTDHLLSPQIKAESEGPNLHYGLGVWIRMKEQSILSHYAIGFDPGVAFLSEVYSGMDARLTIIGNTERLAWPLYNAIRIEIMGF